MAASANEAAGDGLALLRRLAAEGPLPAICDTLGFRPAAFAPGRAAFEGAPGPELYNPLGTVHGGYAATLLDSAMGCAVHTLLPAGTSYVTVELKVNYVRPMTADTGRVRAEGTVIHAGRTVATAEGRLMDADGRLYAHATTTCLIRTGEGRP